MNRYKTATMRLKTVTGYSRFCFVLFYRDEKLERTKLRMGSSLRSQVLKHYKKLLHTTQAVFQNDPTRIASE